MTQATTPATLADPFFHTPAIYCQDLRKEYGSRVAVAGLSLEVARGEVFGFLGPNGAGKTTTVKMMTGLIRPTSGRLSILGRPLGDLAARRRVGFLPEQFRFHEWLRADEFLDFHGSLYGLSPAERRRRTPEVLELVGLAGRARSRLSTFSKGMLQRIGLAQALIADPQLVFLDEPTSALDPIGRRDVRDVIHHLKQRGVTVFLNSHLLSEVEQVCDRAAIIKAGQVAAVGTLDELLSTSEVVDVRAVLPPPLAADLGARYRLLEYDEGADGVTAFTLALAEADVPGLVDDLTRGGARVHAVAPRQRSLEDLFVEIVEVGGDR